MSVCRSHQTVLLATAALIVVGVALAATACGGGGKRSAEGLIAFQTNRDGNYEIYVTQPDGTDYTNLTNNAAQDYSPSWSPDGSPDRLRLRPRRQASLRYT